MNINDEEELDRFPKLTCNIGDSVALSRINQAKINALIEIIQEKLGFTDEEFVNKFNLELKKGITEFRIRSEKLKR